MARETVNGSGLLPPIESVLDRCLAGSAGVRPLLRSADLRVAECWPEQSSCMRLWCDKPTCVWASFVVTSVWDEFCRSVDVYSPPRCQLYFRQLSRCER